MALSYRAGFFATTKHAVKTAHAASQTFMMTALIIKKLSGRLVVFLWPSPLTSNVSTGNREKKHTTVICRLVRQLAGPLGCRSSTWKSLRGLTCCSRGENSVSTYPLSVSSVQKIKLQLQSHRGWHLIRFFSCETPETVWDTGGLWFSGNRSNGGKMRERRKRW